ncbi:cysteine peptidase family C39 domain-containing protein [Aestuariivivens insulae]|uniref:cysteine peptidase family C39 domain-containing protein n=1 Tax=Aestuariivivens insulae TaxID=1621988 RepID=UPI001F583FDA|nr:cysteine peptidase family C39 domain-containing protein [Aestuariivivens insulae]
MAKITIKQHDISDCGAACLASIAAHQNLHIPIARIRQYAGIDKKGANVLDLIEATQKLGLLSITFGNSFNSDDDIHHLKSNGEAYFLRPRHNLLKSMIIKYILVLIICVVSIKVKAQPKNEDLTLSKHVYSFLLIDGIDMMTMKQANENYLSVNRILNRLIDNKESKIDELFKVSISFLGLIITHEEGHRSVLTNLEIGSINQPFSFFKGVAYVKGVTDETLINLRQNRFQDYIRLHTGGLEADYSITNKTESLIALEVEEYDNLKIDYIVHKLSHIGYFLTALIPKLSPNLKEEDNEFERDIVGHDIFGAIRHLHRPEMKFYRYTNYDDLTKEERKFVNKVSFLSLLNLANPMVFGKNNFEINKSLKINAGLGYTLAPFGGFIDENLWLIYKDKIKIHSYIRQFHNKDNWFLGGGLNVLNYSFYREKLLLNFGMHFWSQPIELSFIEKNGNFGYGGNINLGYKIYNTLNNKQSIYLNTGLSYKEAGFIPEYASLDKNAKFNFGFLLLW